MLGGVRYARYELPGGESPLQPLGVRPAGFPGHPGASRRPAQAFPRPLGRASPYLLGAPYLAVSTAQVSTEHEPGGTRQPRGRLNW